MIALAIGGTLVGAAGVIRALHAFAAANLPGELLILVVLVSLVLFPLLRQDVPAEPGGRPPCGVEPTDPVGRTPTGTRGA